MTTGSRIKARRKELGMSAEALAIECGVSPATIYRYEKGDIENMGTDKLKPIAAALHTTPAYLMGWDTHNTTDIAIANNIKKYRELLGTPKQQIADFVGVDVSTIDAWESGVSFPSVGHAEKLCEALSISEDELRSIPIETRFKNHEEDYLSDLFYTFGFSVFYATTANKTSVMIGNATSIYELSTSEFEDFKQSVRDFIKYKFYDTIKNRNPVMNLSLGK